MGHTRVMSPWWSHVPVRGMSCTDSNVRRLAVSEGLGWVGGGGGGGGGGHSEGTGLKCLGIIKKTGNRSNGQQFYTLTH